MKQQHPTTSNNQPVTPVTNTEDKGYTPGELPKSLTLLVTGTGYRSDDDNKETLLLRSIDRTVHLHKEAHPHIVHNMVDRYNEHDGLKAENEKLKEANRQIKERLQLILNMKKELGKSQPYIDDILIQVKLALKEIK